MTRHRLSPRLRRQSGFTLVEIIVAMAIIAIGVMGLISTYLYMSTSSAAADETTVAMNAARAKIDEIIGMTFSTVQTTYQNLNVPFSVPGLRPDPAGRTTAAAVGANPTVLEITVTITWSGATGLRSSTYKTRLTSK